MSNRLYKRVAQVTCYRSQAGVPGSFVANNPTFFEQLPNATVITDLRIQATITKSINADPNPGSVTITNLSARTRADLQTKPLIVRLDAGYDGNLRHVFVGDLRDGRSKREDTEWTTTLQLADGDRAYRYARVNRSYGKFASAIQAVQECASSMGLVVDGAALTSDELQTQFASGHVLYGNAGDELTRVLAPFGYRWSIQDGRLQILKDDEFRPDEAVLISQDTGMIGSPERGAPDASGKPPILTVKMQLYPELTPGAQIQVQSKTIDGVFRIEKVTHELDTHGDDWSSTIEARIPNG